ncbi:MAG: ribosome maturation factor RimM [Proteobacteria bacterium]|nr:ribosome maturation factor RimM [Pseudomonadota bacterium]
MELLEIGRIVRSHGLAGRMKVLSYLEAHDVLRTLAEVFVGPSVQRAVAFPLDAVRSGKGFFIMKLRGIEDTDAAAKLVESYAWMPLASMKKLPEGEYYWREIIGLKVVTEDDQVLGRIESVFPTGSNDVYVCRGGEREILLPAIGEVVRKVDTAGRIMVVRLPEGL